MADEVDITIEKDKYVNMKDYQNALIALKDAPDCSYNPNYREEMASVYASLMKVTELSEIDNDKKGELLERLKSFNGFIYEGRGGSGSYFNPENNTFKLEEYCKWNVDFLRTVMVDETIDLIGNTKEISLENSHPYLQTALKKALAYSVQKDFLVDGVQEDFYSYSKNTERLPRSGISVNCYGIDRSVLTRAGVFLMKISPKEIGESLFLPIDSNKEYSIYDEQIARLYKDLDKALEKEAKILELEIKDVVKFRIFKESDNIEKEYKEKMSSMQGEAMAETSEIMTKINLLNNIKNNSDFQTYFESTINQYECYPKMNVYDMSFKNFASRRNSSFEKPLIPTDYGKSDIIMWGISQGMNLDKIERALSTIERNSDIKNERLFEFTNVCALLRTAQIDLSQDSLQYMKYSVVKQGDYDLYTFAIGGEKIEATGTLDKGDGHYYLQIWNHGKTPEFPQWKSFGFTESDLNEQISLGQENKRENFKDVLETVGKYQDVFNSHDIQISLTNALGMELKPQEVFIDLNSDKGKAFYNDLIKNGNEELAASLITNYFKANNMQKLPTDIEIPDSYIMYENIGKRDAKCFASLIEKDYIDVTPNLINVVADSGIKVDAPEKNEFVKLVEEGFNEKYFNKVIEKPEKGTCDFAYKEIPNPFGKVISAVIDRRIEKTRQEWEEQEKERLEKEEQKNEEKDGQDLER